MKNNFKNFIPLMITLLSLISLPVFATPQNIEITLAENTISFSENTQIEISFTTSSESNLSETEVTNVKNETKQRIKNAVKEKKDSKKTQTISTRINSPISATENDLDILAKIIYAEARGESYQGKLAVGAVVLNRVRSSRYPNTIKSVVFAPGQFSPIKDGSYASAIPSEEEYRAAREALSGIDPTNGALTFYAYKYTKSSYHESLTHTATIGNHKFFK